MSLSTSIKKYTGNVYFFLTFFISLVITWKLMSANIQSHMKSGVLDAELTGYTIDQGKAIMNQLTYNEKLIYLELYTHGYDILLPILFGGLGISLLSWIYPIHITKSLKIGSFVYAFPFIYSLFDYSENATHYLIIKTYIESYQTKESTINNPTLDSLFYIGGWFCFLKYLYFGISLLFILIGLVFKIKNKIFGSSTSKQKAK